jgi:S-formylglutathione hydrolase FrmB
MVKAIGIRLKRLRQHTAALFMLIASCFCAYSTFAQSKVITDSFYSPSVQLQLKYTVVLPANYQHSNQSYPVVYLLHGHTGNYTSWITYAKLPIELATQYNCIIILPDAGNSWYVNWTGQTDSKPHRWHDMVVKDLLPDAETKYRITNKKSERSIGGLSMGGYGALTIGLKNPHLFGFVFSSAGAIDFCQYIKEEFVKDTLDWNSPVLWSEDKKTVNSSHFSTWKERTPQGLVFKTPADADAFDPYSLLENTDSTLLPFIHIDCGNKDYHLKAAMRFTDALKKKTNKYSLLIMPGNHDVPYWEQAVKYTFLNMQEQNVLNH